MRLEGWLRGSPQPTTLPSSQLIETEQRDSFCFMVDLFWLLPGIGVFFSMFPIMFLSFHHLKQTSSRQPITSPVHAVLAAMGRIFLYHALYLASWKQQLRGTFKPDFTPYGQAEDPSITSVRYEVSAPSTSCNDEISTVQTPIRLSYTLPRIPYPGSEDWSLPGFSSFGFSFGN